MYIVDILISINIKLYIIIFNKSIIIITMITIIKYTIIIFLFIQLPGVLKISLAGANNLVPTTSLTPCIIIIHVYTCNYSGARKNIDAR